MLKSLLSLAKSTKYTKLGLLFCELVIFCNTIANNFNSRIIKLIKAIIIIVTFIKCLLNVI